MNDSFFLSCGVCNQEIPLVVDQDGIPLGDIMEFMEEHEYHSTTK